MWATINERFGCNFYYFQSSNKTSVLFVLLHFKWLLPYYVSEDIRSESLFSNQKYGQPNLLFLFSIFILHGGGVWGGEGGQLWPNNDDQSVFFLSLWSWLQLWLKKMVNLFFVIVIIWSWCIGRMMTYFDKIIEGIVVWCHYTNCIVMHYYFCQWIYRCLQ